MEPAKRPPLGATFQDGLVPVYYPRLVTWKSMVTRSSRDFWLAALGLFLLTVVIRLPSLFHPQPIDAEAMYSVVANEIVDGGRPYVDAVERKPPLLFWIYAGLYKATGKFNWTALHALALIWTLGTMAGLYVIGRSLFDRATGLIAALLYGVFQAWVKCENLALNGEMLMNLPVVWAWAIALRPGSSRTRPELIGVGALLCAGFLLKQPAAIAAVPLGIYLLLPSYRASRALPPMASIAQAALLTIGFFGALALAAMVLWKQGILHDALFWTITNHDVSHIFWERAALHTLAFVGACLPLLIGAVLAIRDYGGVWCGKRAERMALLGWLLVSAIGTAAGTRFYFHYYIQLIPPLALLAAAHYAQFWSGRVKAPYFLLRPVMTYAWLALTVVAFSIAHWWGLSSRRQPSGTGRYLSEHSVPADRIFVWGQASKIYLDARRRPASRYITTFPLTGYVFAGPLPGIDTRNRIVPGAWSALEEDFAKHPPAFIVESEMDRDKRYPVKDFPILARLLAENYQPVARTAEGTIYRTNRYGALTEEREAAPHRD